MATAIVVTCGLTWPATAQDDPDENGRTLQDWLSLAEAGDTTAQYQVGVAFSSGAGTPRDLVRAHSWFDRAAKSGDGRAAKARTLLYFHMTPEQIAEAQRLARDWLVVCEERGRKRFQVI